MRPVLSARPSVARPPYDDSSSTARRRYLSSRSTLFGRRQFYLNNEAGQSRTDILRRFLYASARDPPSPHSCIFDAQTILSAIHVWLKPSWSVVAFTAGHLELLLSSRREMSLRLGGSPKGKGDLATEQARPSPCLASTLEERHLIRLVLLSSVSPKPFERVRSRPVYIRARRSARQPIEPGPCLCDAWLLNQQKASVAAGGAE